jgi:hypothetical protein
LSSFWVERWGSEIVMGEGVALAPLAQGDDDGEQVPALVGEDVLVAGAALVGAQLHDADGDERAQPVDEDVPGDAEAALEVAESADPVEGVAHDQQ